MRSTVLGVLVGVLLLGLATPAPAAYLRKSEAHRAAKHFVKKRSRAVKFRVTWRWVEPASDCSRVTRTKVECHYQFGNRRDTDSEGNTRGCFGDLRIRKRAEKYHSRWVRERCGYVLY
jgi:hypothetical protein